MPKPGEALEALIRDKTRADIRFARIMLSAQRKLLSDLASGLREIDKLVDDYRRQGITPDPWLLMRQDRVEQMLRQYERYLAALDDAAHQWKAHPTNTITGLLDLSRDEILAAVSQADAVDQVRVTAEQAFQSFDSQGMLALLADQSTQRAETLFQSIASEFTRDQLRNELFSGFGQGRSIKDTLRAIEPLVSEPRSRLATIVRTETMRAQREALRQSYTDSTVTEGWRWFATGDQRTCFLCLSQHGTIHPLDEPMASHPNCRCVMLPELKSFADLGLDPSLDDLTPDTDVVNETGADLLARMTPEERRQILGPTRAAALEDGRIGLDDLWTIEQRDGYTNLRAKTLTELDLNKPAAETIPDLPVPDRVPEMWNEANWSFTTEDFKVTAAEMEALDDYAMQWAAFGNDYLRFGKTAPFPDSESTIRKMIEGLDSILDRIHSAGNRSDLYRRVPADSRLGDLLLRKLKPGDIYTDPGYTSTALDAASIRDFGGADFIELRIITPPNTKGLPMHLLTGTEPDEGVFEVVLRRGSKFRVLEAAKESDGGLRMTVELLP